MDCEKLIVSLQTQKKVKVIETSHQVKSEILNYQIISYPNKQVAKLKVKY